MTTHTRPTQDIEISAAFSYGWRELMKAPAPWIGVAVAGLAAGAIMGWLSNVTAGSPGGFLFGLASFVVSGLVWFTMVRMSLAAVRGEAVTIPEMNGHWNLFVTYLVASFLYALGVAFSLVLLVVPGIMFAVAYYFFGFVVVDLETDPITALQEARALSKGRRWPLFGAGLLAILVHLLGLMAFGVGILLAIPVTYLAAGHIYQQLKGEPVAG